MAAKTEAVTELEAQVGSLNVSLETAAADVRSHRLAIEQLEQAKAISDNGLKEATEALEKLQADYQESGTTLQVIQLEVSVVMLCLPLDTLSSTFL